MKKNALLRFCIGVFCLVFIFEVCEFTMRFLGIKFPSSLVGMLILFLLLQTKILPVWCIEDACKKFLEYLPICFVPLCVGIIGYKHLLEGKVVSILFSLVLSASLTLLITAYAVNLASKIKRKKLNEKAESKGDF